MDDTSDDTLLAVTREAETHRAAKGWLIYKYIVISCVFYVMTSVFVATKIDKINTHRSLKIYGKKTQTASCFSDQGDNHIPNDNL